MDLVLVVHMYGFMVITAVSLVFKIENQSSGSIKWCDGKKSKYILIYQTEG